MTDEALVEADRLEEDGRWEEAAILRLNDGMVHVGGSGDAWALARLLHVQVRWGPSWDGWWVWRPGAGWVHVRGSDPVRPAESCPADVRRVVEEALRYVLERRFGGTR